MSQWIRTKDKLPKEGRVVLWFHPTAGRFAGKRDGMTVDWGSDLNVPVEFLTHWIPVPEPPEDET